MKVLGYILLNLCLDPILVFLVDNVSVVIIIINGEVFSMLDELL